jgi:tRNA A-37 threonylcarbamoyl transferase component Bud32
MTDPKTCARCGATFESGDEACPRCLLALGRAPQPSDPDAQASSSTAQTKKRAALSPEEIARRFPELEVLALIGEGGMGAVYKARQTKIERLVALKVLGFDALDHPAFAERFRREAVVLARLDHPSIVKLYDFGERDGLFFLVLEFVDGVNLRNLMQQRLLEPKQALAIVPQMCEALQFAHDEGVVHRDIKPENVLIDSKGRVKIADFGLAKLVGGEARDFSLTEVGQVMGTPHYMAPEQLRGSRDVDHRADIYSLGVVLYEMLTGELPRGNFELPSRRVHVDVKLDEIVLKSLERTPERRYQHALEVKTDVESVHDEHGMSPSDARLSVGTALAESAQRRARGVKGARVVIVPGRPWEFFVAFLLLWPLAGLAFNHGAGWFTAAMCLVAVTVWSMMESEIRRQPELASALTAQRRDVRSLRAFTAFLLLAFGLVALACGHIGAFPGLSAGYRSGPSDLEAMRALQVRLLPLLQLRMPIGSLLDPARHDFRLDGLWLIDRERLWHQAWLLIVGQLSCAAAALAFSPQRRPLGAWRTWRPSLHVAAAMFGALLVVHGVCAVVAMLHVEGGPLVAVPERDKASLTWPTAEHGTEDIARQLRIALIERGYEIVATGDWSVTERGSSAPARELQVSFAEPASPFERWRMTWHGPQRVQPHAVFVLQGPPHDGITELACDLGDVQPGSPEQRDWTEWFSQLSQELRP